MCRACVAVWFSGFACCWFIVTVVWCLGFVCFVGLVCSDGAELCCDLRLIIVTF